MQKEIQYAEVYNNGVVSCLAALEPLARLFPNRSGRHQQAFHREVERLPALSASFAYLQPGPQLLVGRVNHTLEVGRSPRRLLRWEGPSLFGTELYYSSNGLTHSAALSKNDQRPFSHFDSTATGIYTAVTLQGKTDSHHRSGITVYCWG